MAQHTAAATATSRPAGFTATFRIPGYGWMWAAGALWHTSRWGMSFLAAYLARTLSESPRLVQLTGVAMWSPLLVGGVIGGIVSDRFDRRRTLVWQMVTLVPFVVAIGLLLATDTFRLWMIYPVMALVGVGWVVDMTSRRALVYDLVGQTHVDRAMALESFALGAGMSLGTLFGGSAVEAIGVDRAFLGIAGLLVVSLALFLRVPPVVATGGRGVGAPASPLAQLRDGVGLLGRYRGLVSILGITAAVNFFYFSYTPLVQVIGRELGARPGRVGLLASTAGFGMMASAVVIARGRVVHRGRVYCAGAMAAFVFLFAVAHTHTYTLAFVGLLVAAVGSGFFGALQSTLVMTCVPPEARGRALGLLSTAIGVLPLGMLALGELAEAIGTRPAVAWSAGAGAVAATVWLVRRPQVLTMTTGSGGRT
jgi:predicted MFS family arabinose efflux permease